MAGRSNDDDLDIVAAAFIISKWRGVKNGEATAHRKAVPCWLFFNLSINNVNFKSGKYESTVAGMWVSTVVRPRDIMSGVNEISGENGDLLAILLAVGSEIIQ